MPHSQSSQGWDPSQWSSHLVETSWKAPFGDQNSDGKYKMCLKPNNFSLIPSYRAQGRRGICDAEMEVAIWVQFPWKMFSVGSSNGSC